MTQRTIDLGYEEFLEKANAYLKACEEKKDETEEFQRLILNALVLAGLSNSPEFTNVSEASLTRKFCESVGLATLRRYANGVSAPARLLRPHLIRDALVWFDARRRKEEERKATEQAERAALFAEIAEAEKNAVPANWVTVGDPKDDDASSVAFRFPCPHIVYLGGRAMPMGFRCDEKGFPHGHLMLACEDGTGFVPARIESKAFLRTICYVGRERGWLNEAEEAAIMALPEVAGLPEELTERESAVVDDAAALDKAVSFGYVGF